MLKCEKTFPIFLHVDESGNFSVGNFCSIAVVIVGRSGIVPFSGITFGWGESGFKHSAMVVISYIFLSVTVSNIVQMLVKRATFQMGTNAS